MSIEALSQLIPDYAKDLRLNISSVLRQSELTEQQAWGTAVSAAIASRNVQLIAAIVAEAATKLSPVALNGAKTAAALMGMTNIFYRFSYLAQNDKYSSLPARLRMQGLRTHGADPVDFELWSLAVSAINGCGNCVSGHEKHLREHGMAEETIVAAVRIASVFHAIAAVLDAEAAQAKPVSLETALT